MSQSTEDQLAVCRRAKPQTSTKKCLCYHFLVLLRMFVLFFFKVGLTKGPFQNDYVFFLILFGASGSQIPDFFIKKTSKNH